MKNALRTHTLNGEYLKRLLKTAVRQGREPKLVIRFEEAGVEVECSIRFTGVRND